MTTVPIVKQFFIMTTVVTSLVIRGAAAGCSPSRPTSTQCGSLKCFNGICSHSGSEDICVCDRGWQGAGCDQCCPLTCKPSVSTPPHEYDCNTTRKEVFSNCPLSRRTCYHGTCNVTLVERDGRTSMVEKCHCLPLWGGLACDQCCDVQCVHGYCHHEPTTHEQWCNCYKDYTGKLCETSIMLQMTESPTELLSDGTTTTPPHEQECNTTRKDVFSHCLLSRIPCYHGTCKLTLAEKDGRTSMVEKCHCLPLWGGLACDQCCDLQCVHGYCHHDPTTHKQRCDCSQNYTGELCEIEIMPTTKEPSLGSVWSSKASEMTTTTPPHQYDCNTTRNEVFSNCSLSRRTCYHGTCNVTMTETDGRTSMVETCHCFPLWGGLACDQCCDLQCVYGYCHHEPTTHKQRCDCMENYTGELCEMRIMPPTTGPPEESTPRWFWYVVGTGILLVVVLPLVCLAVLYYMYRMRVIIAMKLMYYFQKFEDDDGKPYDAFVSYRSVRDDQSFVVHRLRIELEEKRNFKLCLHFRDFIVGKPIADNILDSVFQSRRTILLISPEYLEGEWPMMEYQVAQQEMLKRKSRIIPVVYRDISSHKHNMDRNLKHILDSVTYLEWPGTDPDHPEKEASFWKRLELSMPKKRASPRRRAADEHV